jgi:acetylornithine deacetylase/succinyl-diaminopimelate desuccinylase-like protein
MRGPKTPGESFDRSPCATPRLVRLDFRPRQRQYQGAQSLVARRVPRRKKNIRRTSGVSDALHVPAITVPIANYDNNQHAEDESIRIQNLWDGIETMAALMRLN